MRDRLRFILTALIIWRWCLAQAPVILRERILPDSLQKLFTICPCLKSIYAMCSAQSLQTFLRGAKCRLLWEEGLLLAAGPCEEPAEGDGKPAAVGPGTAVFAPGIAAGLEIFCSRLSIVYKSPRKIASRLVGGYAGMLFRAY